MARAAHRVWHMDVPWEWTQMLRAFSPVSDRVPWLTLRWFPMERRDRAGTWIDCGRWVLYECIPAAIIPEQFSDILPLLAGPQPSRIRDVGEAQAKSVYANDYQCRMYREHNVWARNCWIIQGMNGGHPIEYDLMEQKILQACGLPTDPPPLGTLPYAPFDARVIAQLRKRSLITKYGSLDAARRQATPEAVQREMEDAERAFRQWHVQHLETALAPSVDFLDWYTSSRYTATECRSTLPEMSREAQREVAIATDQYVETGYAPGMGIRTTLRPGALSDLRTAA